MEAREPVEAGPRSQVWRSLGFIPTELSLGRVLARSQTSFLLHWKKNASSCWWRVNWGVCEEGCPCRNKETQGEEFWCSRWEILASSWMKTVASHASTKAFSPGFVFWEYRGPTSPGDFISQKKAGTEVTCTLRTWAPTSGRSGSACGFRKSVGKECSGVLSPWTGGHRCWFLQEVWLHRLEVPRLFAEGSL